MAVRIHGLCQEAKLKDVSPIGSPVSIAGMVVFSDDGSQRTPYFLQIHASARNVCTRKILLLKVSFETLSDGARSGPHEYTNDYFFSPDLFDPGAVEDIPLFFPRWGPRTSRDKVVHLTAEAKVEFVEFEDGAVWGDIVTVKDVLRARQLTANELNALSNAYALGGNEGFSNEIMKGAFAVPPLTELQKTYKKDGAAKAEAMAKNMISASRQHAKAREP